MKALRKRSSILVVTLVAVGLVTWWTLARQPLEAQVLPGAQSKSLLPAKFSSAAAPAAEVQRLKSRLLPGRSLRQKPTAQSLAEKIRNSPMGPQKLSEATSRGALFSGSSSSATSFSIALTAETPESRT